MLRYLFLKDRRGRSGTLRNIASWAADVTPHEEKLGANVERGMTGGMGWYKGPGKDGRSHERRRFTHDRLVLRTLVRCRHQLLGGPDAI
jgi:hypothetical protein